MDITINNISDNVVANIAGGVKALGRWETDGLTDVECVSLYILEEIKRKHKEVMSEQRQAEVQAVSDAINTDAENDCSGITVA